MKKNLYNIISIVFTVVLLMIGTNVWADEIPLEDISVNWPDTVYVNNKVTIRAMLIPNGAEFPGIDVQMDDDSNVYVDWDDNRTFILTFTTPGTYKISVIVYDYPELTKTHDIVAVDAPVDPDAGGGTGYEPDYSQQERPLTDIYLAGSGVSVASLDWTNSDAVTAFIKNNVSDIPDEYTYQFVDCQTDIKGFKHYFCDEYMWGFIAEGYQLIIHADKDGNVYSITGMVGNAIGMSVQEAEKAMGGSSEVNENPAPEKPAEKYTQKSNVTGNLYYYTAGHYTNPTFGGATNGSTYALQDPGRVYTLDYTNAPLYDTVIDSLTSLDALLANGKNFTSKSAEFKEGYNSQKSQVDSITITNFNMINLTDTHFNLVLKKFLKEDCNKKMLNMQSPWTAEGDTLATLSAELADYNNLKFDFTDKNLVFDMPTREMDPDANLENYIYLMEITNSQMDTIYQELPIGNMTEKYEVASNAAQLVMKVNRHVVEVQPALDIHWGLERCMDLYKENFGIDGYDGKGGAVAALVNYRTSDNCSYSGHNTDDNIAILTFGLGGLSNSESLGVFATEVQYPMTNIEIMGHEYTHAVASNMNSAENETTALNESYADIMGLMIRRKSLDNDYFYTTLGNNTNYVSWVVGQMCMGGNPQGIVRHVDDGSLDRSPIYYKGRVWNVLERESHQDAAVQNRWFYLLCTGCKDLMTEGGYVDVTAIPRDSAELITFAALKYFGIRYTDYPQARKNSIAAARMYFGENSQEVQSVHEAWYAVGVGVDEWKPGDSISPAGITNVTTDNVHASDKVTKAIVNGKIVITKNGHKYNPVGMEY